MPFALFYDANVLIPHEIRDILMISAATRLHSVYWSDGVFEEWLRNAAGKNLAPAEKILKFQSDLNEKSKNGRRTNPEPSYSRVL